MKLSNRILFLAVAAATATAVARADPGSDGQRSSPWMQKELTEQFMRALTKRECMSKTVASLKAGCTSDSCLKTLGGITGDCLEWASGDATDFCANYDREYVGRYCASNELDARRCVVLHIAKGVMCKAEPKR